MHCLSSFWDGEWVATGEEMSLGDARLFLGHAVSIHAVSPAIFSTITLGKYWASAGLLSLFGSVAWFLSLDEEEFHFLSFLKGFLPV